MNAQRLRTLLIAMLAMPVAACGGSGGSTPVAPSAFVSVSPTTASVNLGATQQFTAAVTGVSNTAVNWTLLEGADGGAVSNAGLFTASGANGVFHVKATSQADATASATASVDVAANSWKMVWSDEFDGAAGAKPDSSKWGYDTGGGGWGNQELECYTSNAENAQQDGAGNLVITALYAPNTACSGGATNNYTSARLISKSLEEPKFGRIEARMKLPYGSGVWPAFWLLGADNNVNIWPACGEVDIMENVTSLGQKVIQSSLHAPNYNVGAPTTLSSAVDADYHVYGVIWGNDKVQFYVDDYTKPFVTYKASDLSGAAQWKFNHSFFMIMNLAIGGNWPGSPADNSIFPKKMYVDYVRVYSAQ